MSVVPTNYTVAAIANLVPAIDNDETKARTAQVETYGSIITSEDPSITVEAKMAAINSLQDMGKGSRAIGAQDALMKASWYVTESPFAKSIDAAGAKFNSEMMSAGRAMQARDDAPPNAGQMNLDALNRRSADEQKLIAYNMGFSSIDSWKESLQQQASEYFAQNPEPAVKVTLSNEAKASFSKTGSADTPKTAAEQALADLKAKPDGSVKGSAALAIMESAAEARKARAAEREAEDKKAAQAGPAAQPSYEIGAALDRVV